MADKLFPIFSQHHCHLLTHVDKETAPIKRETAPKSSPSAAEIAYGTRMGYMKMQDTEEIRSGPCRWRMTIKITVPWPLSFDCVDCSIRIPNYHYFLDQN